MLAKQAWPCTAPQSEAGSAQCLEAASSMGTSMLLRLVARGQVPALAAAAAVDAKLVAPAVNFLVIT